MSDLNKYNSFLHHMHFLPLEAQTWHNLGALAVVTELCKLTRNLFESRLRPIKGLYIFLCSLSEKEIQAQELVALASTCDDLAELFRFHVLNMQKSFMKLPSSMVLETTLTPKMISWMKAL